MNKILFPPNLDYLDRIHIYLPKKYKTPHKKRGQAKIQHLTREESKGKPRWGQYDLMSTTKANNSLNLIASSKLAEFLLKEADNF